ncbi:hypothetical protein HYALB_00005974 [Hymenoscyphus albidus]|uniref:Major facilitator superfamily (MFS) profile domain-containing protein n=1 Tax=Hymenoscyphus albidus TaxID=595503 RepID=A0A9N9PX52_9HELO|nr:hypothetical protein HYALB_00005974 [Hymenoscyphus albidus]
MSKDAVSVVLVEPINDHELSESLSLNDKKIFGAVEERAIASVPEELLENESKTDPKDLAKVDEGTTQASELKRPEGMGLFLLTTGMMISMFIMSLDKAIIATAIPKISTEFHSIDQIGWYTSAYLLPAMALQPTFGKIYKYFDVKTFFLASLLCFEVGSIICAVAHSSPVFIFGRAISGAATGAIQSGGMVIISLAIPLPKISLFLGTLTSMTAVAGLAGPPIGGVFTDSARLTWRFCFWINLPFGAIAAIIFFLGFKSPVMKPSTLTFKEKLMEMDVPGTVLFVTSMTTLFLALQWGGSDYPWSNSKVWGLLLGSGLLFSAFLALQTYLGEKATIPLRIFDNRSLSLSLCTSALLYLATTVHTFYLPFYFQSAKGTSATSSGLRMLPYIVSLSVTQLTVGAAVTAIGIYLPFMWAGSAVFTIASGLLTTLNSTTGIAPPIGYQILAGCGFGSSMQLCATAVRVSIHDKKDVPVSSALTIFAPFFGGSLAAAIAQSIFRQELSRVLMGSVVANDTAAIIAAGGSDGDDVVPEALRGVVREAYSVAVSKTFLLAVVTGGLAFLCTLGVQWKNIKKPKKDDAEKVLGEKGGGAGNVQETSK